MLGGIFGRLAALVWHHPGAVNQTSVLTRNSDELCALRTYRLTSTAATLWCDIDDSASRCLDPRHLYLALLVEHEYVFSTNRAESRNRDFALEFF